MSSSNANSKPGSDYSSYAYSSYNADAAYGPPPRSYSSDAGSQVAGYSSQPPNAGAKHFNDFKEWPTSWQPFDNVCGANNNLTTATNNNININSTTSSTTTSTATTVANNNNININNAQLPHQQSQPVAAAVPYDNCVPKNVRFYFNALKAISAYYPQTTAAPTGRYDFTNDADLEEYNCLKDGNAAGYKYAGNLINNNNNNNNNMSYNGWKRNAGLINIKRTAGLITPAKHGHSD